MNACFVLKKQQLLVLFFFTTDQVALAIRHLADDTNDSYAQAQIMHYTTENINVREFQITQNMSPLNIKAGESTWSWSQDKRGERTLLRIVERLCSQESHWPRSNLAITTTTTKCEFARRFTVRAWATAVIHSYPCYPWWHSPQNTKVETLQAHSPRYTIM